MQDSKEATPASSLFHAIKNEFSGKEECWKELVDVSKQVCSASTSLRSLGSHLSSHLDSKSSEQLGSLCRAAEASAQATGVHGEASA